MTSDRLDSWKEIAAYLKRSVRTVTRWEREEGLPVHRHLHSRSGTVYAFKPELDDWWTSRGQKIDDGLPSAELTRSAPGRKVWVFAAALSIGVVLSALAWFTTSRRVVAPSPKLSPLTTYPGIEGAPSLSPDGNQVTFERNGDIFVKQVDGEAVVQLTRTAAPEYAPAWSPDGRLIAFTRGDNGVFVVSPLGGAERRIAATRTPLLLKSIAWSLDGSTLVVSEMTSPVCASLVAISLATGEKRRLTFPPEPSIGDGWPAVSWDGTTVAFARYSQDTSANIHMVPLTGGQPRQLTTDKASIFGITWSAAAELVFSSDRDGTPRLWRASTESSEPPLSLLQVAGEDARFPSVSHPVSALPARLAYQRFTQNLDIRRAEIVGEGTRQHAVQSSQPFIASTRSEDHPRYAPDGSKIAFVSQRSGTPEIWVCDDDASNPVRLTSIGGPLVIAPQWSPDGRRLTFFAATGSAGKYAVYVIDAHGGTPSKLTRSETELEALPVWARDGSSLYVTSGRSGSLQIWRKPIDGGQPVQLTRSGGAEAAESPDGQTLFYAKVPEMGPGLWSIPVAGGKEVQVLPSARFGYWAISQGGIYFIDFSVANDAPRPVKFYSFLSRQVSNVGVVGPTVSWNNAPGFDISPDRRWLLYSSLENTDADLMLIDNFR